MVVLGKLSSAQPRAREREEPRGLGARHAVAPPQAKHFVDLSCFFFFKVHMPFAFYFLVCLGKF